MQLRSKRQARWLIATFAAVTMAASLTWWVTTTFNTPDLDLFAILVLAATGAATVALSGRRN
jgi:hypothetical protein